MSTPAVKAFFDPATWTLTYVVYDPATKDAVLIDPVMDFDPLSVSVSKDSVEQVAEFVKSQGLKLHVSLETHAHADHLSGAQLVKEAFDGIKVGAAASITVVQKTFAGLLNMDIATDGSQFDVLLADGDSFQAGSLKVEAIHTPGHTPACTTYKIGDAIFTGDTMFMPDFGTGRCDFPAGSAEDLYNSIQKLYELPDATRVFVGHDYQPGGRELEYETTIGAAKTQNIQLKADTSKEEFVTWRSERDATLRPPKLIFQSIQVNADGGKLPKAEDNGQVYLKLPMGIF
ncbi:MAG: MBL fold metallo-hydrolase [Myxococcota bacterium]|nr:MBL fold metallo-hydrolase [Myxococcota bacterium]